MLAAGLLVAQENTNPITDSSTSEVVAIEQVAAAENESENPAFTIDRYEALIAGVAVFAVSYKLLTLPTKLLE